jgi:putative PIN family toxin of toxin-antitoxin system
MTVVLDANIVVSATFFNGKPRRCLQAWGNREFALVSSTSILEEQEQTIARLARQFPTPSTDWMTVIRRDARLVQPVRLPPICRDPDDEIYIQAAVAGRVDYIVTGDADLLDLRTGYDIPIVTANSLLRFIA